MSIKKNNLFFIISTFFVYSLYAWGDSYKLSNGGCKFDKETGYQNISIYIKDSESFVIIDGGDSRYGTMSTVYNGSTCEEITSGEKYESDFSGVMERKGFTEIGLNYKYIMDKSFQNKITFLENSDDLTVRIEPISNSVTQELKTLLASLSDKSVSSQINISDSAKEFLGYREFYALFLKKINSLSATEINLDYALALNSKLTVDSSNVEDSKKVILAKEWSPIDYDELYKLISGNTLISKDKYYCSKSSSKESCLKIAILEPAKDFVIGRNKAIVIFPDKKKIQKDEWGYYAYNLMHMALHTVIAPIPTDSNVYSFKELVFINQDKTKFRMINPKSKKIVEVVIQKGQNKKIIADARNGNYEEVDNTGRMSIGQVLLGKAVEKLGESLAEVGKNSGGNSSSSDLKNSCYANLTKEKFYCGNIKDKDMRNSCYANLIKEKFYCGNIGN